MKQTMLDNNRGLVDVRSQKLDEIETEFKRKNQNLINREAELNDKHSKVDETQSKLDKHLARIQSVLQPQ